MNSYTENLKASVTTLLLNQEANLNHIQAQLDAATFTLYYAEAAKITSLEKLEKTKEKYQKQETIKATAVDTNNLALTILSTANQEKQYHLQATTNTAVAAANIQIAANAIVRLASDMGSIFSIINAADYDSQIYTEAQSLNNLMTETAYNAEVASQLGMESSLLTAEIEANTIADTAKTTASSITGLLNELSHQLENTNTQQISENTTLETMSANEKIAEGILANTKIALNASQSTYLFSVRELNLNLRVSNISNSSFTVEFNPYLNPFHNFVLENNTEAFKKNAVKSYSIILVKENQKSIFTLTDAEQLIETKNAFIKIEGNKTDSIKQNIFLTDLNDSNGNSIALGENYVVFVLVQLEEEYKKTINNFDDYLTAPSAPFLLTNQLKSPKSKTIKVGFFDSENPKTQLLNFNLEENTNDKVNYRCMFLPYDSALVNGLFTTENLNTLETQVLQKIETKIKKNHNDTIALNLNNVENLLNSSKEELKINAAKTTRTTALDSEKEELEGQIKTIQKSINALEKSLNPESKNIQESEVHPKKTETKKPDFFFNQLIAENVTEGNYSEAIINGKTNASLALLENTTDIFGNPLVDGHHYIPVILSVISDAEKTSIQFLNSISDFQKTESFTYSKSKN